MFKKIILIGTILIFLFLIISPVQAGMIDTLKEQLGIERTEKAGFVTTPTAEQVVVNVIMWMMSILGIIAVGFIIWGGIIYATSGGNEEKITQAKRILLWAIVGLVIAILALTIATFVTRVVRGGVDCMVCTEFNEQGFPIEVKTPFESSEACAEARRYKSQQGDYTCGCTGAPCTE